jgi:hypothetical protein
MIAAERGITAAIGGAPGAAGAVFIRPLPIRERFEERWLQGEGVRCRLSYLRPPGLSWGAEDGFYLQYTGLEARRLPQSIPAVLRRQFPIYFPGDQVEVDVEIVNSGGRTLRDLLAFAGQESFTGSPRVGQPLSELSIKTISELAPGQRAVLRFELSLPPAVAGGASVNFDQTHLTLKRVMPDGSSVKLLDEPQAGVIDPPGGDAAR